MADIKKEKMYKPKDKNVQKLKEYLSKQQHSQIIIDILKEC